MVSVDYTTHCTLMFQVILQYFLRLYKDISGDYTTVFLEIIPLSAVSCFKLYHSLSTDYTTRQCLLAVGAAVRELNGENDSCYPLPPIITFKTKREIEMSFVMGIVAAPEDTKLGIMGLV